MHKILINIDSKQSKSHDDEYKEVTEKQQTIILFAGKSTERVIEHETYLIGKNSVRSYWYNEGILILPH